MNDRNNKQAWEDRARQKGARLDGVLFRGFTEAYNRALHDWHAQLVVDELAPLLPSSALVLDLGCGYGRITAELARFRNDVLYCGMDIAEAYCRLFKETGYPAFQGQFERLPIRAETFDAIFSITSLMYVPLDQIRQVLAQINAALAPGGVGLFLEPGLEIQRMIAWLWPPSRKSTTQGQGFQRHHFIELFEEAGFSILAKGGNAFFSMAAPSQILPQALSAWMAKAGMRLDRKSGFYAPWALHRWLLVKKSGYELV